MKPRTSGPAPFDRRAPRQPDANAIELFARVVAAGSFAQAARELGLSRAAISHRVAAIESQLGVPLFARSTRALGLTEAGRQLAQRARAVADAADAARRSLRTAARHGLAGTLRITASPLVAQAVLAPLLARFQAMNPELRIELLLTNRRLDLLRDDVDVAIRMTAAPPPDCVATPLLPYTVRAAAAPRPPLAHPRDLAGLPCLVLAAPGPLPAMAWQRGRGQPVPVSIDPAISADDLGTLLAIARAGGGVVFAPDFALQADLAAGTLVDVLPGWRLPVAQGDQVVALTLPLTTAPERARALVQALRQALAAAPGGATGTP